MFLRHGAVRGLKKLAKRFQVVLFSRNEKIRYVLKHFRAAEFTFDGVYIGAYLDSDDFDKSRYVQEYCQVAYDFDIGDSMLTRMLVLSSLAAPTDTTRLFEFSATCNPKILTRSVPISKRH
jgi:hypothetical protein